APDGRWKNPKRPCSFGRRFRRRSARWDRSSLPSSFCPKPRSRSRLASALAPMVTGLYASRLLRMSIAHGRLSEEFGRLSRGFPRDSRAVRPHPDGWKQTHAAGRSLKQVRIGLLGCGTVGGGVVKLLRRHAAAYEKKLGGALELVGVADRSLK